MVVDKGKSEIKPSLIIPVIILYLVNGVLILWFSTLEMLPFYYPLLMMMGVPVSYKIFFRGEFEEEDDHLEKAIRRKQRMIDQGEVEMKILNPFMNRRMIFDMENFKILEDGESELGSDEEVSLLDLEDESSILSIEEDSSSQKVQTKLDESFSLQRLQPVGKNKKNVENSSILMKLQSPINFLIKPWKLIFNFLIPVETHPIISFFEISIICFIFSSIQVEQADIIITELNLSHSFIALTFFSWLNCSADIFTVIIATKARKIDLALSTLFYAQVINLQVSLNLGWFLKCLVQGEFDLRSSGMTLSMFGAVFILLIVWAFLFLNNWKLDLTLGIELMVLYLGYVYCEFEGFKTVIKISDFFLNQKLI